MATHSRILAWKNPMDRGKWQATVQEVTKNQMQVSTQHTASTHLRSKALFRDSAKTLSFCVCAAALHMHTCMHTF